MKKSKRFQPVVKVAEAREKLAASALGEAQAELQSHEARLEELQGYQRDYLQRLQESGAQGMGAARMNDYQQFLNNLKLAIEQQETLVQIASRVVEEKKQQWFSKRGKLKSYDNVMERYVSEENRMADRREQKEADDRAQHGGNKNHDRRE